MIVAIANLKGGTGKSCVAVNLACALSTKRSVLLIDADSQGTATFHAAKGLLPVTCESLPLESNGSVQRWVGRVLGIKHDYVVIDSPPHTGDATQAIIGIADLVLIPVTASVADLAATSKAVELVRAAREMREDKGPRCLLIPSRVDTRTGPGRELADALKQLGESVGPTIHQRVAFVDSLGAGQWVGTYAPNSPADLDIRGLADSVKRMRL